MYNTYVHVHIHEYACTMYTYMYMLGLSPGPSQLFNVTPCKTEEGLVCQLSHMSSVICGRGLQLKMVYVDAVICVHYGTRTHVCMPSAYQYTLGDIYTAVLSCASKDLAIVYKSKPVH